MTVFLGPLDSVGRVPPRQQTRVAAFLMSCHGAMARQLTIALASQMKPNWHNELNAQLFREAEIVSLLLGATSWVPDLELPFLASSWESAWLPKSPAGIADRVQGLTIDMAALGHALHAVIRPAALLPSKASTDDPFTLALRKIEFESSRLIQAQILFLKDSDLLPVRDAVNAALESRHLQVRELWTEMLDGIGVRQKQAGPSSSQGAGDQAAP
jgi:hypothetical protein